MTNLVTIDGLTKKFGAFKALDNINLQIEEGEIFGYIGPNGAGKTTTMKILVGLISRFQGTITVAGYNIAENRKEVYKLLGYLPQAIAFQDWRTTDHALKTFGKLSGLTDKQLEERIPQTLAILGLADVRFKKVSQLSGGMTQKVGLAQALLHEPKLLVLDEPLNGLDPLSRRQFKDIVRQLAAKGATVLFSSHILSDVQDVADRVGIINRGTMKEVGNIEQLKAQLTRQKTIEVMLAGTNEKWMQLRKVKGISDVTQPRTGIVLANLEDGTNEEQVVNDVLAKVVELDIRVRGVWLMEPTLDQIYFNYISEAEN